MGTVPAKPLYLLGKIGLSGKRRPRRLNFFFQIFDPYLQFRDDPRALGGVFGVGEAESNVSPRHDGLATSGIDRGKAFL